jgi:prefoldin subunit 5
MHSKFTPEQLDGELFTLNDLATAINELCEEIEALEAQIANLNLSK